MRYVMVLVTSHVGAFHNGVRITTFGNMAAMIEDTATFILELLDEIQLRDDPAKSEAFFDFMEMKNRLQCGRDGDYNSVPAAMDLFIKLRKDHKDGPTAWACYDGQSREDGPSMFQRF